MQFVINNTPFDIIYECSINVKRQTNVGTQTPFALKSTGRNAILIIKKLHTD